MMSSAQTLREQIKTDDSNHPRFGGNTMKLNSGPNSSRNCEEKSRGSQKRGNKNINLKEVRQKKDFTPVGAG